MNEMEGVAFVTYETSYAPCGGIAAVTKFLPAALKERSGLPTVVLTPFHYNVPKMKAIAPQAKLRGMVAVSWEGQPIQVQLLELPDETSEVTWIACLPDDRRFFAGVRHPYDLHASGQPGADLQRDTLLFGTIVAKALHVLGPGMRWAVMMQDWECATTALALARQRHSNALFLTLHNSYDSGMLHDSLLVRAGLSPAACVGSRPHATVLDRVIPRIKKPIFTVSRGFAADLREDPFQRDVMTPHLQPRFFSMGSFQVIGVDNGPFTSLSIPDEVLQASHEASSNPEEGVLPLRKWKLERRRSFCSALHDLLEETKGNKSGLGSKYWGDIQAFLLEQDTIQLALDEHAPWFVMGGRDDSRQKGYDVAAHAIRQLLEEGLDARFLFFPIPGDEGLGGLRFLADLSWDFPDRVLVFPFVFRAGYMAALQGATYALMPSFYEPFGAANEFYLSGTVGIGRATGGLVQQVIPLRQAPGLEQWEYPHAVAWRSERWHGESALPTGLLYREPDGYHAAAEDWRGINEASYRTDGKPPNRLQQRQVYGTWRHMAAALKSTMQQAVALYQNAPLAYDTLLLNGVRHISDSFSWKRAAEEYLQCVAPHSLRK